MYTWCNVSLPQAKWRNVVNMQEKVCKENE